MACRLGAVSTAAYAHLDPALVSLSYQNGTAVLVGGRVSRQDAEARTSTELSARSILDPGAWAMAAPAYLTSDLSYGLLCAHQTREYPLVTPAES